MDADGRARAALVLEFVRERGDVHPRQVDDHFAHGTVTNYWGGSSSATTHLLEHMHYRGLLRVTRREKGIRIYAVREITALPEITLTPRERVDALDRRHRQQVRAAARSVAVVPREPAALRRAAVAAGGEAGAARARQRLAHARVDNVDWYWPAGEDPQDAAPDDQVRLLAPFDPIVWDRRRFELLWGWPYRFEAYTPVAKRKLGYYALPLLWRDRVVGWGNLSVVDGGLTANFGYADAKPPRDAGIPARPGRGD